MTPLVQRIDALLPQTQCTRCGFEGCRPYAEALAEGRTDIDRCPPGGDEGAARLASLLGRPRKPVDAALGGTQPPQLALIDESACIGCTKCIQACPVDAIVGAPKLMHTVIAAWCTGCELCVAPCPVDCISIEPTHAWPPPQLSRERHQGRAARLLREAGEREALLAAYE